MNNFLGTVEVKISRLESMVEQVAETVIVTSETVARLSDRVDALAHEVQQHGYQIMALNKALQTLAENQDESMDRLTQLAELLERLMAQRAEK